MVAVELYGFLHFLLFILNQTCHVILHSFALISFYDAELVLLSLIT